MSSTSPRPFPTVARRGLSQAQAEIGTETEIQQLAQQVSAMRLAVGQLAPGQAGQLMLQQIVHDLDFLTHLDQ